MLPNKCHPLCLSLCALCLLAAGVAGCDAGTGADGGQSPVAFAASVSPVDTRAGELTTANLASMGVIAYYTQSPWATVATSAVPNFMNDQRVAKSGSAWTYAPVKYWPNTTSDRISFFAYAPHSSDAYNADTGEGVYEVAAGVGSPQIYYRTPVKEKEQTDLLAATGLIDCVHGNTRLTFTMRHILTKVEFRVKSTSDIKVDVLRLINVATVACVEFDKASGAPQVRVLASADPGYRADMVSAYLGADGSIDVPASEDPAVPGTTIATFYLPPLKPELGAFRYSDDPAITPINLPGGDLWKPGKHVVYTIVIEGGAEIKVTADIGTDWPLTDTDAEYDDACAP